MVHLRISLILHVVFDKATLCLRIFHHERFARNFSKLGGRGGGCSQPVYHGCDQIHQRRVNSLSLPRKLTTATLWAIKYVTVIV